MSALPASPTVIFMHLPKTGGRTLLHVIRRQYGRDAVLELYASTGGEELAGLSQQQVQRVRVVSGHFYFGVHACAPEPAIYVTLLRDPVDRVISHYYFVRSDPAHYLYDMARELSLREYVVACGPHEPNNDQTRLVAGSEYASHPNECPDAMLVTAKRNLGERFAVVGLTEEFDRSLLLMQQRFGWSRPFYVRRNTARRRPRKEEIAQETLRVIEAYNELDIELYRYGHSLFVDQCSRLAGTLEADLRTFQRLNGVYGTLWNSLSTIKRYVRNNV